jgi:single-strand DNA-binding protein
MAEYQGSVKKISDTESVGSNNFRKRDVVITDNSNEKYPQHVQFQFTQDKCALLDNVKVGDVVKVQFGIQGKEWTSPSGEVKYFNTLSGCKIEVTQAAAPQSTTTHSPSVGVKYPDAGMPPEYVSPKADKPEIDPLPF